MFEKLKDKLNKYQDDSQRSKESKLDSMIQRREMQVAQETKLYEKRQKLENLNKTLTKIRPKQPDFVKGLAAFVGTPPQQQQQGKYRQQQQFAPPNLSMDFAFGLPPLKNNKKMKQRPNQPFFG